MLRLVLLCHQCRKALQKEDRFCSSCGAPVTDVETINQDPLVGRVIANAYIILDLIGSGGMGRVYRAEQKMLGRTVAIKVIHPHLLSDEQTVARFYTEAKAASRLNHPNSVSIIDFGRTEDEILYLVMEYLRGKDLAQLMNEEGPLPFIRICEIIISILTALGEAHALQVIHRDLKPENIFIERTRTGRDLIKVVDFGLAKLMGGPRSVSITSPGLVCGTPDYMSPEQGRGEEIDGRGDIYSVGVLLFELLTEQLPFTANTPTKLVLKHIQEPVPDPRQVAPERNISQELVDVTLRALAKKASDRYQTADEMIEALHRVIDSLTVPSNQTVVCGFCGKPSIKGKLFCAECGATLKASIPAPPMSQSLPSRFSAPPNWRTPLVGRAAQLEQIDLLREQTNGSFVSVSVAGEPGIGKTRLLAEAAKRALDAGDLVEVAGPYETGDPIPYWAVLSLLTAMYRVNQNELAEMASPGDGLTELYERAGIEEALDAVGLKGSEGRSRAGAVAAALARAIIASLRRTKARRLMLVIDDLDQCDGLTARVLSYLPGLLNHSSVFLLSACSDMKIATRLEPTQVISLSGLTLEQARSLMSEVPYIDSPQTDFDQRLFSPLYLEQLKQLGMDINHVDSSLQWRLADLVAQRLQRLDVSARRVLQTISVLGNSCSKATLWQIAGVESVKGLETLRRYGFVSVEDNKITVVHPFIRDFVKAFIPAQARKELHERALEFLSGQDVPIEVRAGHAYHAGEILSALMLLERTGNLALSRGDLETAVSTYQRGLELARRAMLETGDTSLDAAIASFSYKLGSALARIGDLMGAQGVLRESLELTKRVSPERARMLVGLGKVVAERKRFRDAYRVLSQALEIGLQLKNDALIAEAHAGIASVRRADGDPLGAAAALWDARELLDRIDADALQRAQVTIDLADALIDADDYDEARARLEQAERFAIQADAPFLSARAESCHARIDSRLGNTEAGIAHLRNAIRLAAQSGDVDSMREWERQAKELSEPSGRGRTIAWER
ncbi:MAG: protein kinase [Deltaproteobacteria bacterium]|nr:protein kinase [Deltaproteobacteria bacterium]